MGDSQHGATGRRVTDLNAAHAAWDVPETSSRITWVRRTLPLLFVALVLVAAWRELADINLHATRSALQGAPFATLVALQALGLLAVFAMCLYDGLLARALDLRLEIGKLLRYSWVANTFNNLIGLSGLAGSGIRFVLLAREGIDTQRSIAYSGILMVTVPVGLSVLSWPILLGGVPSSESLPFPSWLGYAALAIFALYLPVYVFLLRSTRLQRRLFADIQLNSVRLAQLTLVSTLDWVLAATVAWSALRTVGVDVPALDFVTAFALAAALGIFSLVPGGLGVFDASLLWLLASRTDVSGDAMLAGLLLYRAVYYVVPWLIGVYLGAELLMTTSAAQRSRLLQFWRGSAYIALLRLPLHVLSSLGVRALSYLTAAAGVVLLVSAAYPTLTERLTLLNRVLPLAAIETSHLLSVGVGVLLVALARGIGEQVRRAYLIAIGLLLAGAVLSLLKGIDFEEAAVLSFIALLLRLQRAQFYRASFPVFSVRNLVWLVAVVIAVLGYATLGNWIHGDAVLAPDTLLQFALAQEAPRFLRSLWFAALVLVLYLAWSAFRSPLPHLGPANDAELAEARSLLQRWGGGPFGHLLFLGDKNLFWSRDRRSVIGYGRIRDRLVALGDPCGDPQSMDAAIMEFREFADRHNLVPVFYEVSAQHAHRYHDAGFALFKLGEMAYVDIAGFSLSGKRGESLRHSVNRARRIGLSIEWLQPPFDPRTWQTLQTISDAWKAEHRTAEKTFSLGNFTASYLSLTPVAAVKFEGRVVAFANLMPDYGDAHDELSIDLMRHLPDAPASTMDFLFVELIDYARRHNYRYFNLGVAPLSGVGRTRFARAGERLARFAFDFGSRLYNYKGVRSFKEKFRPQWRSCYLAYPAFTPLPALLLDTAALISGGYRRILFKAP